MTCADKAKLQIHKALNDHPDTTDSPLIEIESAKAWATLELASQMERIADGLEKIKFNFGGSK